MVSREKGKRKLNEELSQATQRREWEWDKSQKKIDFGASKSSGSKNWISPCGHGTSSPSEKLAKDDDARALMLFSPVGRLAHLNAGLGIGHCHPDQIPSEPDDDGTKSELLEQLQNLFIVASAAGNVAVTVQPKRMGGRIPCTNDKLDDSLLVERIRNRGKCPGGKLESVL